MNESPMTGSEGIAGVALFLPSKREAAVLAALGMVALGAALVFRYAVVENTPLGLACEANGGVLCGVRHAAILLFMWNVFGVAAMIAALRQLWRPNVRAFGAGLVFALLGLVLYNTRLSALAVALLVLSLARPVSAER